MPVHFDFAAFLVLATAVTGIIWLIDRLAFAKSRGQQVEAEFLRSESVERRKAAEQDEIVAAVAGGLLDRELVDR